MKKYIIKRILISIPIFLIITFVVYILSNLAPGGPIEVIAANSGKLSPEDLEALKISYGLDKPVLVRYGFWLMDLFHGDLGDSYSFGKPVALLISQRIGPTLLLAGVSLLISILIGIPLGIVSACKQYSKTDTITSGYSYISQAMPGFFIAFILIYIFAAKLGWLPTSGMYDSGEKSVFGLVKHMVLPVIASSFSIIGIFIRQTRSATLEVMNEDYIKTARSKGISKKRVILKHAVRNAMLPVVAVIGMCVANLLSGSVVVEQIFGWPGTGSLMMTAIEKRDYPIIMGLTVLIAAMVLIVNLLLDIVYAALDPRISFGSEVK